MRKSILVLVGTGLLVTFMGSEKENAVAMEGAASSKAAVPVALVGQWRSGSLDAANYYDSNTQQWNEPNGRGMFLIVRANGEYRFGAGEEITTTDYYLYQEGTISMNGSQMVLTPKLGCEYTRDVCTHEEDQSASTKNELQASTLKFQIVMDQAGARGAKLVLTNEQGELITLRSNAQ